MTRYKKLRMESDERGIGEHLLQRSDTVSEILVFDQLRHRPRLGIPHQVPDVGCYRSRWLDLDQRLLTDSTRASFIGARPATELDIV